MSDYLTLEQAKRAIINGITEDGELDLAEKITAVSRLIDNYLDVPDGYFYPGDGTPSTRKLVGQGLTYIILPAPLSGEVTITVANGYTVPNFDVVDRRLITLDEYDNPATFTVWQDIRYTVSGIWGYAAIPPQIVEAAKEALVHIWRGRDKGFAGVVLDVQTSTEVYPERDLPRTTRRILDEFAKTLDNNPTGGYILA